MAMKVFKVGVDVSKKNFHACVLLGEKQKHRRFARTAAGVEAFRQWLQGVGVEHCHVCLEATGPYGEHLSEWLHDGGCEVSVVTPKQIKAFAESGLSRTKTDKKDATLIARFCEIQDPVRWEPLPLKQRQLRDWSRRLDSLNDMTVQESNRLEGARDGLRVQIEQHLEELSEKIEQTKEEIRKLIDDDPDLKSDAKLLESIPGVGEATIKTILAELGDVRRFHSAKALAAYVGVAPRVRESGQWKGHTSMSKTGRSQLRKAFFLPAMVAGQHNPLIKPMTERLLKKGKSKMAINGARMRKLIHIIYGVLKNRTPFDPHFQNAMA
jgi:transposase